MVLSRSNLVATLTNKIKDLVTQNHRAWKEIVISVLCGLVLVMYSFPEVAFLGATLRVNDIVFHFMKSYHGNVEAAEHINILPVSPHRSYLHAQRDWWGSFLQSEPGMEFMLRSVQNRESPFWNPYSACGALGPETMADNKFAVVNWIYAFLGGGQRLFNLLFLASVWFAAVCMHRFLRGVCKLSQVASCVGAAFFVLNGWSVSGLNANLTWSYYFLPACLLACCRLIEQFNLRRLAVTSIAIASVLSFTFLPTTTMNLLTVAAVCLCFLAARSSRKADYIKPLISLFVAGILAFCLVSAIYLPIIESLLLDVRELYIYGERVARPFHWLSLFSLFSSSHFIESYDAHRLPEYAHFARVWGVHNVVHIGIVAAFLVGFALVIKKQERLHHFFTWGSFLIMLLFLFRIFGMPGVTQLIDSIPLIGGISIVYLWTGAILPATILVAFGMNYFESEKIISWKPIVAVWATIMFLGISFNFVGFREMPPVLSGRQVQHLVTMAVFMLASTMIIILIAHAKKSELRFSGGKSKAKNLKVKKSLIFRSNILCWVLALLLFVNLVSEKKFLYFILPDFFVASAQRPDVQFLSEKAGLYRVLGMGSSVPVHAEQSAAWGIYVIGSTNLAILPTYEQFYRSIIELYSWQEPEVFLTTMHVIDTPHENIIKPFGLNVMGVRYIVFPETYANYASYWENYGFVEVAHFSRPYGVRIFENPHVWPRAFWLPTEYLLANNMMFEPEFRCELSEVNISSYHHAHLTLNGFIERDGVVVLTDNWHRNWRAVLNGEAVEIVHVHGTFRGVHVSAGDFVISMSYRPSTLNFALFLMGFGLAFCALGLLVPNHTWKNIIRKTSKYKSKGEL